MKDGETLYLNILDLTRKVVFQLSCQQTHMVKITNLKSLTWGKWPTLGNIATSSFTPEESPDPGFWVPNDYVVVKVALRGSSGSNSVLSPWSKREAKDYYEVIEWASQQEWSNGNGERMEFLFSSDSMVGSLPQSSSLKAMIPWEGLNDMYRESLFMAEFLIQDFTVLIQGIFARWPNNPNIEGLIQAQKITHF